MPPGAIAIAVAKMVSCTLPFREVCPGSGVPKTNYVQVDSDFADLKGLAKHRHMPLFSKSILLQIREPTCTKLCRPPVTQVRVILGSRV